ncbi:hypothetical protein X777_08810, partial [Ooceraea biroi]
ADYAEVPMASATTTNIDSPPSETDNSHASYWRKMLKSYEKRNASLERRRSALVERVRFMECTLPSLLVGAAASAACGRQEAVEGHRRKTSEDTAKLAARKT